MKNKFTFGIVTVTSLILVGCGSTHTGIIHVEPEAFVAQSKHFGIPYSISLSQFIGHTHDRAYIEQSVYLNGKNNVTVYWVHLDELSDEIAKQIKTEQLPWIPFDYEKFKENQRLVPMPTTPVDLSKP